MLTGTALLTALVLLMYFGNGAFRVFSTLLWAGLGIASGLLLGGASASPFLSWFGAVFIGAIFAFGSWHGPQISRFLCGGLIPTIGWFFLVSNAFPGGQWLALYVTLFVGGGLITIKWTKALQVSMTSVLGFAVLMVWNGGGLVAGV